MKRFEDGARVCFVGDSITHTGIFVKHIYAKYREMFPESRVEFYNCGISGGNLGNTIKIFDEDIAIYEPTHIVLMIGVNDSRINLLAEPATKERYDMLTAAFREYQRNLEKFHEITRERGIEFTLCTPVPYAEYMESDGAVLRGGYALVLGYAEFVRKFAAAHKIPLCDYHAAVTEHMQYQNLYNSDRVHPNEDGHVLMAKTFLAAQGIEYDGDAKLTGGIEEWYTVTQKLRNVVATEYFNVPDYTQKPWCEREECIKKLYSSLEDGTYDTTPYFASLIREYVKNKQHHAEYVEYVKHFMKDNK